MSRPLPLPLPALPAVAEPVPKAPPPPPPKPDPRMRVIRGRRIFRLRTRDGDGVLWREISDDRRRVLKQTVGPDGQVAATEYAAPEVLWECSGDPWQEIHRLNEQLQLTEFDPRDVNRVADQVEGLVRAGYGDLVEALGLCDKIPPRQVLDGLPLGQCWISRGIGKLALPRDKVRAFLHAHAHGDWGSNGVAGDMGELSDDQLWAPPLFGIGVQNAVSIKAGRGLVRSVYPGTYEKTRGNEDVKIITLIGHTTIVYAPSRDVVS